MTGPGKPAGTASGTIILSAPGMPMLTDWPRDAHADRPRDISGSEDVSHSMQKLFFKVKFTCYYFVVLCSVYFSY